MIGAHLDQLDETGRERFLAEFRERLLREYHDPMVDIQAEIRRRGGSQFLAEELSGSENVKFLFDHPKILATMWGSDEVLFNLVRLVEKLEESSEPVVFESTLRMVFENKEIDIKTLVECGLLDNNELDKLSNDEILFLRNQITEYKDLKTMQLDILESGKWTMKWGVEAVKKMLEGFRSAGLFMEAYGRFCQQLMVHELLDALPKVEKSQKKG